MSAATLPLRGLATPGVLADWSRNSLPSAESSSIRERSSQNGSRRKRNGQQRVAIETPFAEPHATLSAMVTCERCGSDELSLLENLPDGRKRVKCDKCGHIWDRGKRTIQVSAAESRSSPPDQTITTFVDDDAGYEAWFKRNRVGYVLNCTRNPSPDYLILHVADCYTITEPGPQATTWTGDYIKVCSRSRPALEEWTKQRTGETPSLCGICFG